MSQTEDHEFLKEKNARSAQLGETSSIKTRSETAQHWEQRRFTSFQKNNKTKQKIQKTKPWLHLKHQESEAYRTSQQKT